MSDGSLFDMDTVAPRASSPATSTASTSSLYRKYRPQSFEADDLFGQEHVVNTLRNAIALDRIAHAYLFCGPRGTGKTTTARLMAKAVNCLDPDPHHRPCNTCDACIAINRNATTDVIEIDAASNRGIDDIRDLRERVKYAPTQLRTKFYIIDEAHQITGAAANAFLKTLEEPPAHTKFVLATTDPEELLQTIVSRCQRFDFRRIGLEAMSACLRKVATLEHIEIEETAIDAIARHATGSLRDGLGLLDQVSLYREHAGEETVTVTVDLVRKVLGISRNERVEGIVAAIADRDAAAGLRLIGEAVDDGEDVRQLAKQILTYVRLLLIQRARGSTDADETARNLAQRFDLEELAAVAHRFGDVDFKIRHAVLPQLPLELAFIDVIAKASAPTQPRVTAAVEHTPRAVPAPTTPHPEAPRPLPEAESPPRPRRTSLRDRVRGDAVPATDKPAISTTPAPIMATSSTPTPQASTPVAAGKPAVVEIGAIIDLWPRIRADVKAIDRKVEAIMQQIDPVTVSGDTVVLASPYEFHRNRMNQDDIRHTVEDVLSRLLQTKVKTTCVSHEDAAVLRNQAGQAPSAAATVVHETTPPPRSPGMESSTEDDERRINAVKNLFDADEVPYQPRTAGVASSTGEATGLADDEEDIADN